jgi:hypothetical protein
MFYCLIQKNQKHFFLIINTTIMTAEPSIRMKYVLGPGVEHGEFVSTDVAPVLLRSNNFITALTQSSFATHTIVASTGVFSGLIIPVTAITGAATGGSMFFAGTGLNIYTGTGWIHISAMP